MLKSSLAPLNAVSHVSPETASPDVQPFFFLEVRRGRTSFPHRPVMNDRFLVGSGEGCDLRLGGPEIPLLHSIVRVEHDRIQWEAISATPRLIVNGNAVDDMFLNNGDRVEIDGFQFVVHQTLPPAKPTALTGDRIEAVDEPNLEDLSALELVERLEASEEFAADFHKKQKLGAEALLQAATQRALENRSPHDFAPGVDLQHDDPADRDAQQPPLPRLVEIERIFKQLGELSLELQGRSERLALHEVGDSQAITDLFETQHKLLTELESVLEHLSAFTGSREQHQEPPARAIA